MKQQDQYQEQNTQQKVPYSEPFTPRQARKELAKQPNNLNYAERLEYKRIANLGYPKDNNGCTIL